MRIADLALKDLLQIFRDWKAFLYLLIMPIIFTLVFGFAFGGFDSGGEETDPRLPVGFVNHDPGQLVQNLYALLEKSELIRPENLDTSAADDELEKMVADDEYAAILIVPTGYSEALLAGEVIKLPVILKADTSGGATTQNGIQAAVNRLHNAIGAARFSTDVQAQIRPFENEADRAAFFNLTLDQTIAAWDHPPFTVQSTQTGTKGQSIEANANAFAHSSPGMMVQFAIAGLIGAAEVIVLERKSGSLQRLLTTSISRMEVLLGHFLAMFVMIFVQFVILIGFAALFLDVSYFDAPLATLLVTLTTALFTASMGLLIGALAKSEEQSVMFSLIPMFILSGLGGAWVPLEFTSQAFQTIGHFTPVAWAMDGFQNIVLRGMGLDSVLLPAAVLMGFSALCFGLAVWRFRFETK